MGLIRFICLFIYMFGGKCVGTSCGLLRIAVGCTSLCLFYGLLYLTSNSFTNVHTITRLSQIPQNFDDYDIVFNRDMCP